MAVLKQDLLYVLAMLFSVHHFQSCVHRICPAYSLLNSSNLLFTGFDGGCTCRLDTDVMKYTVKQSHHCHLECVIKKLICSCGTKYILPSISLACRMMRQHKKVRVWHLWMKWACFKDIHCDFALPSQHHPGHYPRWDEVSCPTAA